MATRKKTVKKKASKKKASKKKAAPVFKPSANTQAKMRKLREAYDEIDTLNKQIKKVEAKRDELEAALATVMKANGLNDMGNDRLSLFFSNNEFLSVRDGDWRSLERYVKKHGCFELYQRRISSKACAERFGDRLPKFLEHHSIPVLKHRRRN